MTSRRLPVVLFLDVDGVLIPYGSTEDVPDSAQVVRHGPTSQYDLLDRVDPGHGERLARLGCELVWATGWEEEANDVIAPRAGLPQLPLVAWHFADLSHQPARLHWKTRDLIAFAGGRAFVWLDDEIGEADREWVAAHHLAPALLQRIDPHRGLTDADLATVARWLSTLD